MPSKTWKTIADQRRKENFVGRAEQLRVFTENFTSDEPTWMVLSITGEGGVGKSTLLKRCVQESQRPEINANVVQCDDHHYTPVEAMATIAEQLAKLGIEAKTFSERHKKYRETLQQIESDPAAPRGMVNAVARGLTDFAVKSLRRTPGVGVALDYVDEKAAGDAIVELTQYAINRWGNKDEVQLVREPEKILTPLFVDLLNNAAEQKRLVVMFDVFERTATTLSSWLMALFNSEYGEIDLRVSFILSGRDRLEQHWTELARLINHVQLEPFTPHETALYLSNQGITDESLIEQIHEDTGGLPVLVELLAATDPQVGEPLPDISHAAVDRFLQWTPDDKKRRIVLLAVIPRQFNLDILSALLGESADVEFTWLVGQSYIRSGKERGWFYHEKVRELMLRYLSTIAPETVFAGHSRLEEFFAQQQDLLELERDVAPGNRQWCDFEEERLYHAISGKVPDKNYANLMNSVLPLLFGHIEYLITLLRVPRQVMFETLSEEVIDGYNGIFRYLSAFAKNDDKLAVETLTKIENTVTRLVPEAEVALLMARAIARGRLFQLSEIITDVNRAMELMQKPTVMAYALRALAYSMLGEHENAISDFNAGLSMDPALPAIFYNSRGESYQALGNYEAALKDFTYIIDLDGGKSPAALNDRGEAYISLERFDEALVDFNRALAQEPDHYLSLLNRGKTFMKLNRPESALEDFNRALEQEPDDNRAMIARAEAYQTLGRLEDALADLTQAPAIEEDLPTLFTKARILFVLGRFEEALSDLNKLFDLADGFDYPLPELLFFRGTIFREMERYDDALADFTQALQAGAGARKIFLGRGESYFGKGLYAEALADFNQAMELDGSSDDVADIAFARGKTFFVMESFDGALDELNKAITLDAQNATFFHIRGLTHMFRGNFDDAVIDFEASIALDEDKKIQLLPLEGQAYGKLGKIDQALDCYTQALELDPNNADLWERRALIYIVLEQYAEARHDLDRAIEIQPEDHDLYISSAQQFILSGNFEAAIADLSRALALTAQPELKLLKLRGEIYQILGMYKNAIADFTSVIEVNVDLSYMAKRAEAYLQAGKFEEALADLNQVLEEDAGDTHTYFYRGEVFRQMKKYAQALADYTNLFQEDAAGIREYTHRSVVYTALGNSDAAQQDLQAALAIQPEDADDHYHRATALILDDRGAEALAELEIAMTDLSCRVLAKIDDLLDPLRDLPEFKALLAKYEPETQP